MIDELDYINYVELPPRAPFEPMEDPIVNPVEDIKWREGLWTVTYKPDGSMGICDWPIPGDRPDGQ